MKMSISALDGEIAAVERAIAADRRLLEQAFVGYVDNVRETALSTIASPKFLLGALGVGFIAGKFLFRGGRHRKSDGAPVKNSMLGLLGAGALSLAQAQFGGPVGLVRWISAQIYRIRRSARHATATQRAMSRPTSVDDQGYTGTVEPPAALLRR